MSPAAEPMKKILLASSSAAMLERNHNLLMRRGFQLFGVRTGQEALQCHREHALDLVVAEMQLEDMGGDTLCSRMRVEGSVRDAAVILICQDQPDHLQRVASCSANAMLLRPVSPVQLMELVGKFLDVEMVRSKRADLSVPVEVADRNRGGQFCCLSRDISRSGIRLESEFSLEQGSRIACTFTIPLGGVVEAEGQVVREMKIGNGRSQYGVQFVRLSSAGRRHIESHVARNSM